MSLFGKNSGNVKQYDYVDYEHGPVYRFFSSMGTHITKLMMVNIMFIVSNIPMMLLGFAYCLIFLPMINSTFQPKNFVSYMSEMGIVGNEAISNSVGGDAAYQVYYLIIVFCVMFLLGSLLICVGPFQAGYSLIYRNIARGTGTFVWDDFKEGVRKNWKQSSIAMVISLVVSATIFLAIAFYLNNFSNHKIGVGIATAFVVLFFIFSAVQNMVYMMIVSLELPLKKIYNNAIRFFLIKFGPCIGILAISILVLLVVPFLLLITTTYFAYAIAVMLYLSVAFALVQYMFAFFTWEQIDIFIIKPTQAAAVSSEESSSEEDIPNEVEVSDETEVTSDESSDNDEGTSSEN